MRIELGLLQMETTGRPDGHRPDGYPTYLEYLHHYARTVEGEFSLSDEQASEVDREFLQGGRLNDFGGTADFILRHDLAISAGLQYEQWKFPLLSACGQSNISASVQLTLYPNWHIRK